MPKIISIHSFRGGTGKSNTTANLAVLLAAEGCRVGVIDTDIQSPGIHILFGLREDQIVHTLNDYLWGKCTIQQAAYDVTQTLDNPKGQIFLIPSSLKTGEIARILDEGYDVGLLNQGFVDLVKTMQLDVLLIDTHPGLNQETLLSIAISHALIIALRPDQQDYLGTGVTLTVARKLKVSKLYLLVNKVPASINTESVKTQVEQAYNNPVAAVLPHSEEMMLLGGEGVFVIHYPHHPITDQLRHMAHLLME
jgi:MinD-like ATPase involved in chromosome partitioning or flagellar assembly